MGKARFAQPRSNCSVFGGEPGTEATGVYRSSDFDDWMHGGSRQTGSGSVHSASISLGSLC